MSTHSSSFAFVVRCAHARGIRWDVESGDEIEGVRTETIIRVEVADTALNWVLPCIMRDGLLQTELVKDPLALVLDVKEAQTMITSESGHQLQGPRSVKTHVV